MVEMIFCFIMAGIAAVMLYIVTSICREEKTRNKTCTCVTDGTIVSIVEKVSSDNTNMDNVTDYKTINYLPVVTYEVNYQSHTVQSNAGNSNKPIVGSKIKVHYNPCNPEECYFEGYETKLGTFVWLPIVFIIVFGGLGIFQLISLLGLL